MAKLSSDRNHLGQFLKKHGEGVKMEEETPAHEAGETPEEEEKEHSCESNKKQADEYISTLGKKKK